MIDRYSPVIVEDLLSVILINNFKLNREEVSEGIFKILSD